MENNHISFWGRTLEEYTKMFSLGCISAETKILSIADGPSTFNLELRRNGVQVVSVDPIYSLPVEKMRACFEESYLFNKQFFYTYPEKFNLKEDDEVENLLSKRRRTFETFVDDYVQHPSNYQFGKLPSLNFLDKSFDLCLCSNFLFLFEHLFDLEFHLNSIKELLRLGKEIRIFPLYNNNGQLSNYLEPVTAFLSENGHKWTIEPNDYHVYKNGNRFLKAFN
ncbi:MAG: SAM-dependent methyltransferase [Bacteroidetes bacterium]|nr:SAM-dependent methyltransferase [Bacteroidota bacterium]